MSTLIKESVFDVKMRVDREMVGLFAGILAILATRKENEALVRFRTRGGDVGCPSQIINILNNKNFEIDFLIEEEVSSAGVLILPSAKKVYAKRCARFQWHHQIPYMTMSQLEIEKADWTKAEYLSSKTGLNPETYFKLMAEKKLLLAEEMKNIGLIHEIIPC